MAYSINLFYLVQYLVLYVDFKYFAAVDVFAKSELLNAVVLSPAEAPTYQPDVALNVTLDKREQEVNAPYPILVTLSGIVMLAKFEHQVNAKFPILVTLFPIVILVKFEQL